MIRTMSKDESQERESKPRKHIPVMPKEVLQMLNPGDHDIYVDGTLGMGGHAKLVLAIIGEKGKLIGIDQDAQSLKKAEENLHIYKDQCVFVQDNFKNLNKILKRLGIRKVDRILLDLGISSFQLDNAQRGFSLRNDGPLDMRMDQDSQLCAYDLVNSLSEKEISNILKEYGQERMHNRIARFLVTERAKNPIETTSALSHVVLKAMPQGKKRERIHPATRTFQAFRIAVNRELEALDASLDACIDALSPGGRLVVISFHSLEDKIVKGRFKTLEAANRVRLIVKKPLRPSEEDVQHNSRARSARLRVAERI